MKKKFTISEEPLPSPLRDDTADIEGRGRVLIKSYAELQNKLDDYDVEAEEWEKGLFLDVLQIVDSLERVLFQAEKLPQEAAVQKLVGYVRTTAHQLNHLLQRRKVVPFDTIGEPADPELTEIIDVEERDDCLDEEVIEEIEKGYKYKEKLLRRAKVIICQKKEDTSYDKSNRG